MSTLNGFAQRVCFQRTCSEGFTCCAEPSPSTALGSRTTSLFVQSPLDAKAFQVVSLLTIRPVSAGSVTESLLSIHATPASVYLVFIGMAHWNAVSPINLPFGQSMHAQIACFSRISARLE